MNINIKIDKIVMLHALCGCETWAGSLREEHSLGMFKNRVMRKMSGLKREQVTGNLHNEDHHDLYCPANIDDCHENDSMNGACGTCGGRREICTGFW